MGFRETAQLPGEDYADVNAIGASGTWENWAVVRSDKLAERLPPVIFVVYLLVSFSAVAFALHRPRGRS